MMPEDTRCVSQYTFKHMLDLCVAVIPPLHFTKEIRERKIFTILVKRLLHLRLDLCPVPVPHGRVLQVLDQRHGAFELLNARLDGVTDLPVFVLK